MQTVQRWRRDVLLEEERNPLWCCVPSFRDKYALPPAAEWTGVILEMDQDPVALLFVGVHPCQNRLNERIWWFLTNQGMRGRALHLLTVFLMLRPLWFSWIDSFVRKSEQKNSFCMNFFTETFIEILTARNDQAMMSSFDSRSLVSLWWRKRAWTHTSRIRESACVLSTSLLL